MDGDSRTLQETKDSRNILTGLRSHADFLPAAKQLIAKAPGTWCCLAIDIQHFKIFNVWFGREKGSHVLASIGNILEAFEQTEESVAAYFGRDNYAVFLRYDLRKIETLFCQIRDIVHTYSNTLGFLPACGIYVLPEQDQIDPEMYDKARIAVEDAKSDFSNRIRHFDVNEFNRQKEEYQLITEFQDALKNDEIQFYLQPQCNIINGKIIGAEALARWIKPDGTLIPPYKFIPCLEENGFITNLDKAVWEAVCRWIRSLIDRGLTPIPVSVNVSQIDLYSIDVPSYLYGLIERYNIPARLLHVEITESAFASNFTTISTAVTSLKEKGFTVMLDDFGSGYSSLNMLDKINTDIIKLDMAFMRKDSSLSFRGVSIVESIVSMTKTLGIPVIIEGVENADQVDFLKNLGCTYAQGYYYYRPVSREVVEELLPFSEKFDFSPIANHGSELFRTREFLDENTFPDTVLNHILGPVAFYTQTADGSLNISRFNEPFFKCIADINMEKRTNTIQNYVLPEDHILLNKMLESAYNDPVNGGECTIRFTKSGGGVFWYNMHLYFLKENEQGRIFYGKIVDATKMNQQAEALYRVLKADAFSAMRIDLDENLIYELGEKAFNNQERCLPVEECLQRTADVHIEDPKERQRFVEFFSPSKLRRSHEAGIYNEELLTEFSIRGRYYPTRFSAYYIKFLPDQNDNVYIFTHPMME